MSPTVWFVILLLIALALIVLATRFARSRSWQPPCPNCGQRKSEEISRRTLDSRTVHFMPGGGSSTGGDTRLQLDVEGTFHCEACDETFKYRYQETQ